MSHLPFAVMPLPRSSVMAVNCSRAAWRSLTILWVVAGDEIVEVPARQRVGTQGEVLVGAQVVDPQALGPVARAGGFSIEEEHVCFDALRVEDARWQAQQGMNVAFLQ